MKSAYKVLAYLIAALVVVQSAAMVFAVAGLGIWVEEGGVLDAATMESEPTFTGALGFMIHGMNGMMLIPLVAVALLVVSFFAKVPGGVRNAAVVLGLVVLQVALGLFGHENAYIGMLHGVNALVLFAAALFSGRAAAKADSMAAPRTAATV
ncbi:DUF6220 domain-containing protein [Nocardioides iriomotensis]|uniref:Uncharacterized protein n=1 Tax=Nocardioides iriomotensis TaxID=715784 RepID=A0A4Q5J926_9ACTN|nr:DUF6220 domain-containing protein [Nocardioides iriomotensis]RYU15242.1 hypothetical protein ETU37_01485 [Nocardioides iriomotensis]